MEDVLSSHLPIAIEVLKIFKARQEPYAYQLNMDGALDLRLPVFLRSSIGGTGFGKDSENRTRLGR